MVISKSTAQMIAVKLTEKNTKEIAKLQNDFSDMVRNHSLLKVPKDILAQYIKTPNWFKKRSSIQLVGSGFNYTYVSLGKDIPCTDTNYIDLGKDAKNALLIFNKIETLKKDKEKLILEIETALLQLKTYAKITTEFKKAAVYLPYKIEQSLTVSVKEIESKIL